jgi:6-pyruvoyltetrahydropterin/6-carboxytetrahydropterin synthase
VITITTKREVPIGHRLLGYNGRCAYLHGHNYVFEVSITGQPDDLGLVVDFKDVKRVMDGVLDLFDHSMVLREGDPALEVLSLERVVVLSVNPSAENFASLVFNELSTRFSVTSVVVRETEDGWARATKVDPSVKVLRTTH